MRDRFSELRRRQRVDPGRTPGSNADSADSDGQCETFGKSIGNRDGDRHRHGDREANRDAHPERVAKHESDPDRESDECGMCGSAARSRADGGADREQFAAGSHQRTVF
jgi:hypothetical protein